MAERDLENEALKTGAIYLTCECCGAERLISPDLADSAFGAEGTAIRPRGAWKVSSDGCSTCMPWAAVFPYRWMDDRKVTSEAQPDDVAAYAVHLPMAYAVADLDPELSPGVSTE